ncbi:MAG: serine protease [Desulfobacteraceae bacterium]|nr:serine protease [Desulfobacteraceae bacterium]
MTSIKSIPVKTLVVLFLSWFLICPHCFAGKNSQATYSKIAAKVMPAVVTIIVYDYNGKIENIGSGFFYNEKGDILTNSHVLTKNTRAEIKTKSGKKYPIGSIIERNEKTDIVRAHTRISNRTPFLRISRNIPAMGNQIMVAGSPMGLEQTITNGIISAWRKIPAWGRVMQISAPISPGSSGGPVLNMAGEVVGIATCQMIQGQNLNFAVPVDNIFNEPKSTKLKFYKNEKGITIIE